MASVVSVEKLASGFALLAGGDARARWTWAHQVKALRESIADAPSKAALDKQIGAAVATAMNRAKPYSAQWVRAYVNAAAKYPTAPTIEQAEAFVKLCNGHTVRKSGAASTKEDALKMMISGAKMASKRGADADEIRAALETYLSAE